jgi:hypothetical protein
MHGFTMDISLPKPSGGVWISDVTHIKQERFIIAHSLIPDAGWRQNSALK